MTDATIAGVGIAQFPTFHVRKALEQGLLAQVLTGQDSPGPSIQLVYPSRKYLPKRVGVLLNSCWKNWARHLAAKERKVKK